MAPAGPDEPLRVEGFTLRRNLIFPGVLLVAAAVALVDLWAFGGRLVGYGLSLFAVFFGTVFGVLVLARDAFPLKRRAVFTIDASGLRVDDAAPVPPEDITLAKLVPKPGAAVSTVLELGVGRRRTRRLRLWLAQHDATRAMHALGALPGERRTPFPTVIAFWKRFLASLALGAAAEALVALPAHGDATLAVVASAPGLLFLCLLLALALGYARPTLLVGAEGFALRLFGRERFVHFRDVLALEPKKHVGDSTEFDTLVKLRSGKTMRLRPVIAPDTPADIGAASQALFAHLGEALRRYHATGAGAELRLALAREGRSGREWLSALDALARGGAARYRVAAIDPDQLTGVARDPNADADARIAAATALLRTGDPRHKQTVRVTAEACAVPELRETLLAVAEAEDDAAMAAALDRRAR